MREELDLTTTLRYKLIQLYLVLGSESEGPVVCRPPPGLAASAH